MKVATMKQCGRSPPPHSGHGDNCSRASESERGRGGTVTEEAEVRLSSDSDQTSPDLAFTQAPALVYLRHSY